MSLGAELAASAAELLEQSVNAALRLDPDGGAALGRFSGKVIAIELQDSPLTLYCLPAAGSLMLLSHYGGQPDTTLRGRPLALLKLVAGDSRRVLLEGEVRIEGDVELGQQFKQALDRLHIDWEEQLARISGDLVAHKAGNFLREVGDWWGKTRERLAANGAEYLQQEMWVLPTRAEVEQFYRGVETLRDDVARLAAKLDLLANNTD
ncbi:MAG: SCP2 sterol-binding domain-containing protein [Gammaproteobacteria bacterium]|jgi:ubiquinone biosynthesis accessory factor UbiJ